MRHRNQREAAPCRGTHPGSVLVELYPLRMGIALTAVLIGLDGGLRGLADINRLPTPAEVQVSVAAPLEMGEVAPRDHVPCPGCGACCVDLPGIPTNCLEVTPLDCVLMFGGNPQEIGTDCHDFNGTQGADACEPGFPMCVPLPDGSACQDWCPGPLPCNPSKVRINLATFTYEILECECNACRVCVDCDAFPPPCAEGCPAPETCSRAETCHTQNLCDLTCRCVVETEEACCIPSASNSCQMLTPTSCLKLGGMPLGSGSVCHGVGTCCYDITDDFCIYDTCADQDGACCAALGGVFQGVGSTCDIQVCCIDGTCCELDDDCCTISGGVIAGTNVCSGVTGACCHDGDSDGIAEVCLEVDAACCADLGGFFHGPNSTCSPNIGACCFGFTGGSCIEMNETCCADLEAGTFFGHGSVCLGDLNGNGFDDTCEGEPQACCLPHFAVTCQERLPADCFALGGTPQGSGTVCLGHEACCLPDGSCTFIDRVCCDDLGGTSLAAGTFCEGTGVCCRDVTNDQFLYDTCDERDKVCCEAEGGLFQGVGTSCDIQACCLDGVCGMLDADCCQLSDGIPQGPGSVCRPFGDVHPKPAGDGDVDVDDILKVLDAFVDPETYPNGDIHPCGGDGDEDVDDILAILDAFSGIFLCPDQPCP